MKTIKRFFELMCSGQVPDAAGLCQCAKCSCNFDKSKAKSTDAGCECPNCKATLTQDGKVVEDQAAKEIKADGDGDMDAKNATRQPALEAGGPGSGRYPAGSGGAVDKEKSEMHSAASKHLAGSYIGERYRPAQDASAAAHTASAKAFTSGKESDHAEAAKLHEQASEMHHTNGASGAASSNEHYAMIHRAFSGSVKSGDAAGKTGLQAGFNGNQHKSAKELAAEHTTAADTASKVAASASKAARGQDPSNKEGLHDSAMTMHTAAKSLHELAAQKHRSAGEEDCAKDHDEAAEGHGDEIQAHKGVIEACGGVAANGNGKQGLTAGGPGSGPHHAWTASDYKTAKDHAELASKVANESGTKDDHLSAARAHQIAKTAATDLQADQSITRHATAEKFHMKAARDLSASDATPAAGLQLDCSACVEAKNFKSVLNPIADGIIMYMPSGTHTITPSQNGRPVTVSVAIDASAADRIETQRKSLEASGKKPFFSVQHSTQIAAFWPAEFFWDTRLDATGSLVEGVWARGEWTRAGREAVEGKDFRTFSPTFFVDAIRNDPNRPVQVVCNDEAKANMGALENDPAFQTISPLWCSNAGSISKENRGVIVACHNAIRHLDPDIAELQRELKSRHGLDCSETEIAFALV